MFMVFQPERAWEVDIPHMISLIDDRTRAIVIINPSNPCGSVYSRDHLREILKGILNIIRSYIQLHYRLQYNLLNCYDNDGLYRITIFLSLVLISC